MFRGRGVGENIELMLRYFNPLGKLEGMNENALASDKDVRLLSVGITVAASEKVTPEHGADVV